MHVSPHELKVCIVSREMQGSVTSANSLSSPTYMALTLSRRVFLKILMEGVKRWSEVGSGKQGREHFYCPEPIEEITSGAGIGPVDL